MDFDALEEKVTSEATRRRLLQILFYEFEPGFEEAFTYLEEEVLQALPNRKF